MTQSEQSTPEPVHAKSGSTVYAESGSTVYAESGVAVISKAEGQGAK